MIGGRHFRDEDGAGSGGDYSIMVIMERPLECKLRKLWYTSSRKVSDQFGSMRLQADSDTSLAYPIHHRAE